MNRKDGWYATLIVTRLVYRNRAPRVRVLIRQRYISAVMYSVLPSSPHATFAVGSPVSRPPSLFSSGAKIWTPPGPVAKRFPFASIFIPSGNPLYFPTIEVTSAKTRPGPIVPSGFIGYAIQTAFLGSDWATYRVFSSGENAIPLGRVISLVSTVSF